MASKIRQLCDSTYKIFSFGVVVCWCLTRALLPLEIDLFSNTPGQTYYLLVHSMSLFPTDVGPQALTSCFLTQYRAGILSVGFPLPLGLPLFLLLPYLWDFFPSRILLGACGLVLTGR